jgi:hypothetical protein
VLLQSECPKRPAGKQPAGCFLYQFVEISMSSFSINGSTQTSEPFLSNSLEPFMSRRMIKLPDQKMPARKIASGKKVVYV